ncbi:MAG TPA: peroxiredoxin-like family protein [Kofleriaceae bacterium]|jgi:peroxiredoxin
MIEATTLNDQISVFTENMAKAVPPEVSVTLGAELKKLAASQISKRALQVGATAPDFTLPDPRGTNVTLSNLLARGPVVVTFYRGGWCPFCDLQLRAYQNVLADIHAFGAELVAVSPQTPDNSLSSAETKQLTFPVVSDSGNHVARQYGLVYKLSDALQRLQTGFGNPIPKFNGDDSWELPMPGTFVLDRHGKVVVAHVDPNYMLRLEPATILGALASLT